MSEISIYRVQDTKGRGPFRPGFSKNWSDENFAPGVLPMPTWIEEFGFDLIVRKGKPGEHFGSGVKTLSEINKWFSETEQKKLSKLGFYIAHINVERLLGESQYQVVFARREPLNKNYIIIPWGGSRQ